MISTFHTGSITAFTPQIPFPMQVLLLLDIMHKALPRVEEFCYSNFILLIDMHTFFYCNYNSYFLLGTTGIRYVPRIHLASPKTSEVIVTDEHPKDICEKNYPVKFPSFMEMDYEEFDREVCMAVLRLHQQYILPHVYNRFSVHAP